MSENKILNEIKNLNSNYDLNSILDPSFKEFGRVLDSTPYKNLYELLKINTEITESNVYVASEAKLFDKSAYDFASTFFGGIDIQIGYCNGMNQTLNGMEYHKSPEIIVAGSDILLFLAKPSDLKDFSTFDQSDAKVFFAKEGSVFALNPEILHLSPSCVHKSGFKSAIILPKGTNLDLGNKEESNLDKESQILFKNNKWMISHKDRKQLVSQGVKIGITGINSRLIPLDD
jgi:hypothetical protein